MVTGIMEHHQTRDVLRGIFETFGKDWWRPLEEKGQNKGMYV